MGNQKRSKSVKDSIYSNDRPKKCSERTKNYIHSKIYYKTLWISDIFLLVCQTLAMVGLSIIAGYPQYILLFPTMLIRVPRIVLFCRSRIVSG